MNGQSPRTPTGLVKRNGVSYSTFAFSHIAPIERNNPLIQNTMQYDDIKPHTLILMNPSPQRFDKLHNPKKQISPGNSFRHLSKPARADENKKWSSSQSPIKGQPSSLPHTFMKNLDEVNRPNPLHELFHSQPSIQKSCYDPFLQPFYANDDILCKIFLFIDQQCLYDTICFVCSRFKEMVNNPSKVLSLTPATFRFGKYPDPRTVQAINTRLFHCPWQDIKLHYRYIPHTFISWLPSVATRVIELQELVTHDELMTERMAAVQQDIINTLGSEKLPLLSRILRISVNVVEKTLLENTLNLRWLHVDRMERIPFIEDVLDGTTSEPYFKSLIGLGRVIISSNEQLVRLASVFSSLRRLCITIICTANLTFLTSLTKLVSLEINYNATMHTELVSVLPLLTTVTALTLNFEKSEHIPGITNLCASLPPYLQQLSLVDNLDRSAILPSLAYLKNTLHTLNVIRCAFQVVHYSNAIIRLESLNWTTSDSVKHIDTLFKGESLHTVNIRCDLNSTHLEAYHLISLTRLDLSRCDLRYLPNSISSCRSLRFLDIMDNPQFRLSPNIGLLTSLEGLHVGCSYGKQKGIMSELPSNLSKLINLRVLVITGTCIQNFPTKIWNHSTLQHLDLSDNCIAELPSELFDYNIEVFPNLEYLLLHNNQITSRPQLFESFPSIKFISFDDKGFIMPGDQELAVDRNVATVAVTDHVTFIACSFNLTQVVSVHIMVDNVSIMRHHLQIMYYLKVTFKEQVEMFSCARLVVHRDTLKPAVLSVHRTRERDDKIDSIMASVTSPSLFEFEMLQHFLIGERVTHDFTESESRWTAVNCTCAN
jgi:Leucine-rich repeat (LRR) protein